MTKKEGLFIMIDGIDGSGKTLQTELLCNRLRDTGFSIETISFPQYGKKSAGPVEEYLNGKYGTAEEVTPEQASIFFAIDRYDASFQIKQWLDEGKMVITNRYVSSNMGHQGGKIKNPEERKKFFQWNYTLEFDIFKLPRPHLNLILHVAASTAQELVDKKGFRTYLNGAKRDIHEANIDHLKNAEATYLEMVNLFPEFKLIECMKDDSILPPDEIHNKIWEMVSTNFSY